MKNRTPVLRRTVAKPNCTHIDMDRLFGHHQCQLCYRFPSLGWVYICRQDSHQQGTAQFAPKTMPESELNSQSPLRAELEAIGLSNSVIEAAEKDSYTAEQLEILKLQKLHLKQVISLTMQIVSNNSSTPTTKLSENSSPITGIDGASVNLTNSDRVSDRAIETSERPVKKLKLKHKTQFVPPCMFKVCHTCRPYYKDRIYLSFGAVFAGEITPLTPKDAAALPVGNANVLRSIGLKQPPQKHLLTDESAEVLSGSASQCTIQTTQSERDDLSRIRQSARYFYNKLGSRSLTELRKEFQVAGFRNSLKNAFHNLFRMGRESSSEGSNITLPLPGTGKHRNLDQNVGEFDLSLLKRIRSVGRRTLEAAQNDSMPIVEAIEGKEDGIAETNGDSLDSSEDSSDYSAYSGLSDGSEVEVDGGVALTEEAVEMHTPDIIT
ncbi:hypothetical protein AOQ84DRAFT_435023 [Glonium stellatum]|uniref:Uncharacterized protein n=1 Tax=Glonium stellatum TaxID=574774 RepID=A0A8E2FGI8_9PEZI|nr:hypothetical protein AOQ84DRAFT_435023 [Glonium stellatum]